jgi:signal peptidase I
VRLLDRTASRLPQPLRTVVDWTLTIAVACAVVLGLEAEVAKPYRIPSSSMEPTLRCARPASGCSSRFNDRVIANRLAYRFGEPRRGQIVVFEAPAAADRMCGLGGTYVKRLIGLPGDVVSEADGVLSVNGRVVSEPYVDLANRDHESGEWRVPKGHYFFMGDNRTHSCDSREWGSVPRSDLIGPVLVKYWPP